MGRRLSVVDMDRRAIEEGASRNPAAFNWPTADVYWNWPVMRFDLEPLVLAQRNNRIICLTQPSYRFHERVEDRLQIECRAAYDFEHIGGGSLLLQGFAQLVEQPGVLDGDDGLGGEILNQLDLLVGERLRLLAVNDNRADQLVVLEHRRGSNRSCTTQFGEVPQRPIFNVTRLCRDVGDVCDLPRPSPLWVKSSHMRYKSACPLTPKSRHRPRFTMTA